MVVKIRSGLGMVSWAGLLVLSAIAVLGMSCHNNEDGNQQTTYTQHLVNSTFTVTAGHWSYVSFSTTSAMSSPRLEGTFTASGGSGNDIKVLVMNATDYTNWSNGHAVSPIYNSGQLTTASITVSLSTSTTYYIVYDNTFSTVSDKSVSSSVDLKYEM